MARRRMPQRQIHRLFALPEGRDEGTVWLQWLVRLRWLAILAQVVTLSFTVGVLDQAWIVIPALLGVVALLTGINGWTMSSLQDREVVAPEALFGQLLVDVISLTVFFIAAGGPANPFVALYLVHVAMGSVMLRGGYSVGLAAIVAACYGLINFVHLPLHFDQHSLEPDTLLTLGRMVAFAISTFTIALFVAGLSSTSRQRNRLLLEARDRTARVDRLRSVGTLAAGAAHELNTPMATITLRLNRIGRRHIDSDTVKDVSAMRSQLERCTGIVNQLLFGAGDPTAAGMEQRELGALVDEGLRMWSRGTTLHVVHDDRSANQIVEVPPVAFTQALINLLENAREAQEEIDVHEPLAVLTDVNDGVAVVVIRDRGCGIGDNGDQIGDPFYTSKPSGTGLGVFVARSVADGAGGGLSYVAHPDGGTVARWWFPAASGG